jgi:hypothetical protein
MPALAAPAQEARPSVRAGGGRLAGAGIVPCGIPGYEDTRALDGLRASEYRYLDAEGQIYLDYTGAGLPAHHCWSEAARHGSRRRPCSVWRGEMSPTAPSARARTW